MRIFQPYRNVNRLLLTTVEKAHVLGVHFADVSGTGNYYESFERHKEEFENVKMRRYLNGMIMMMGS